jgi:hypothetical protein
MPPATGGPPRNPAANWHATCVRLHVIISTTDCTHSRAQGIARRAIAYERRRPEHSVLEEVIEEHLETFLAVSANAA